MARMAAVIVGLLLLNAATLRAQTVLQFQAQPLVLQPAPIESPTVKSPKLQQNTARAAVTQLSNSRTPLPVVPLNRSSILQQPLTRSKYSLVVPVYRTFAQPTGSTKPSKLSKAASGDTNSRREALGW